MAYLEMCDDPKYSEAIRILSACGGAPGCSGYGVDVSDLDPRPLQDVIEERDFARRVALALWPCYRKLAQFDFDPFEEAENFWIVEDARRALAAEVKREAK